MNTESILQNYNFKSSKFKIDRLVGGLDGSTFLLSNQKDENAYVVKVSSEAEIDKILYETEYITYLDKQSIPVPNIIRNNSNGLVSQHNEGYFYICSYVIGNAISGKLADFPLTHRAAKFIAKLHTTSKLFVPARQVSFEGHAKIYQKLNAAKETSTLKIIDAINQEIEKLNFDNCPKSAIHGDITRENLLVKKSEEKFAGLIDFGDCHYDYIIWDLSIALTHLFITKTYGIDWLGIENFYREYSSLNQLNSNEKSNIVSLMIIRNLSIAAEVAEIMQNESYKVSNKKLESVLNSVEQKIKLIKQNRTKLENIFVRY